LEKAFVVENAENGEDYSTNPEFKQPLFYKYIQVITEEIPMVQNYLDSILKKCCLNRVNLQAFLKSENMDGLSPAEFKDVSSQYDVKITNLRRSMLYLAMEVGDAFVTEKSKIDRIGFIFDGARSLMLDLAVHMYKKLESRFTPFSSSSAYLFTPGLSSIYLTMYTPTASFQPINLTGDVVERGGGVDAVVAAGGGAVEGGGGGRGFWRG